MRPDLTLAEYATLLQRLHAFLAAWEPAIAQGLGDQAFFDPRRKLGLVERDLAALGMQGGPACADLPDVGRPAQAMGSLYVLEGSTLGGQVVSRHVEARLGFAPGVGTAYYRSYGARVGECWRAFRTRLAAVSSPGVDDMVVAAAQATFASLHRSLTARPVHG